MRFAMAYVAIAVAGVCDAAPRVDEFAVPSPLDNHVLHGEVDRPATGTRAVVVMFPGSGTHTRDFPSAARGAPRSFVFRELSDRLVQAGFATVRYDERGLGCGQGDKPDAIGRCFNDRDAARIDWNTLHADALAIYRHAVGVAAGRCVIALGHSEGVVHIGSLIARGEADPAGVVAISGAFGPIDRVLRYQQVELIPDAVAAADANRDGLVTAAELAAYVPRGPLSRYGAPYRIPWPDGWSWPGGGARKADIAALRFRSEQSFAGLKRDVLSHRDDEPYSTPIAGGGTSVVASYGWYKPFFRHSQPVVRMFSRYDGRIAALFGGIDGNIDAGAEAAALRRGFPAARRIVTVTPDVGHTLGENASAGAMRADRQDAVVDAVRQLTDHCPTPSG